MSSKPFKIALIVAFAIVSCLLVHAQTESASLTGSVKDSTNALIVGAEVRLQSIERGTSMVTRTNADGIYVFPSVRPGQYRLSVKKEGFQAVDVLGLNANVQEHLQQNIQMSVGSADQSMTVTATDVGIDTQDATVSTAVDREFAENLPLNGRSFQTLIQMTPGVVLTPSTYYDAGQFSVNGQRASSNYWMVDGVSANIGVPTNGNLGNGGAGALGGFSAQGGTNSLVSVDALQEFRIQTSTYAPEFGRTPGAQISILTRSGTNHLHGTAFDYFRNDVLDANDWFANNKNLPKAKERQNDFGVTVGGPLWKDHTFYFLSYEGLRLRLPQTGQSTVPDQAARENAIPAMQPFLNAYPLPNGPASGVGQSQFNSTYSDPSSLDAASVRIDHRLGEKVLLFGRYSYSPSSVDVRGAGNMLSNVLATDLTTHTVTVGFTWIPMPRLTNELRFNYSHVDTSGKYIADDFGGATPPNSSALPLPAGIPAEDAFLGINTFSLTSGGFTVGKTQHNTQRQINVVDSVSVQVGAHQIKAGIDWRRLSPISNTYSYLQNNYFADVPSSQSGTLAFHLLRNNVQGFPLFRNISLFGQDTWRINDRITVTYGLRWDIDFSPGATGGPKFAAIDNFNLFDVSTLALAPVGTAAFATQYSNFAPRAGVAYQLSTSEGWNSVIRGGFGVFYDLATQEAGQGVVAGQYPFGASSFALGGQFPLGAAGTPPPISQSALSVPGNSLFAFDPHLKAPYSLQWNAAFEQEIGRNQSLSLSYIGSMGRRLIQTDVFLNPNPSFVAANIVVNAGTSDYHALQAKFQKHLNNKVDALASYSWAHSIDTGSASSIGGYLNLSAPLSVHLNRGPSDFDVRHSFSTALTIHLPGSEFLAPVTKGWSLQSIMQARSALPVGVYYAFASPLNEEFATIRPDLVPGQSIYLRGSQYPGGKAINPEAFSGDHLTDSSGNIVRQGNLGRNAVRGFNAVQWDFGVHRDFHLREPLSLQFRAELFNILNHPNFGDPDGNLFSPSFGNPVFGVSTKMLARSLNANGSGLNPLYQIGGPRSVQLALKLFF